MMIKMIRTWISEARTGKRGERELRRRSGGGDDQRLDGTRYKGMINQSLKPRLFTLPAVPLLLLSCPVLSG